MRKLIPFVCALTLVFGIACNEETGTGNGGGGGDDDASVVDKDGSSDADQTTTDTSGSSNDGSSDTSSNNNGSDTSNNASDAAPSDTNGGGMDTTNSASDTAQDPPDTVVKPDTPNNANCGSQSQPCCDADGGNGTCDQGLKCCSGVPLPPGTTRCLNVCPRSDRNLKKNIESIDKQNLLDRLASLPIKRWEYKDRPKQRAHIGPMAQDFRKTFGMGASDRYINLVDANGITMAAIQRLNERLEQLERENDELRDKVDRLESDDSAPICR